MPNYGSENFFEMYYREISGLKHERKENTESKANDEEFDS